MTDKFAADFTGMDDEELVEIAAGSLNQYDREDLLNLTMELANRLNDWLADWKDC